MESIGEVQLQTASGQTSRQIETMNMMEMNSTLNCTLVDENTVECSGIIFTRGEGAGAEELVSASNVLFWVYLLVYAVLVLFAGRF